LRERLLKDIGDDVGWFVNIPQPVGFVNDHEVPRRGVYIRRLAAGELIGADDDGILGFKWPEVSDPDPGVVGLRFEDGAGEEKLLRQFLVPLLAEVGGCDRENAAFTRGPFLGDYQPRLDGLAESDFVCGQCTFR